MPENARNSHFCGHKLDEYKKMTLRIATIMAVYHADDPDLLAVALDSVFEQKFTDDVESRLYLAIDGPVPVEINRVISDREAGIYRIHRTNRNVGLAASLNQLIEGLNDELFIFRMDSDDRSLLNRYQSQLDYFKENPTIDILGTDIIEVDLRKRTRRKVRYCSGPEDAVARLCRGVPVAHPTVCFRRHVLDNVGGYPLAGTNEDIALWFRCAQVGFRFDNVPEPLFEFTVSQNFWRRRSMSKAFSELRCYVRGIWHMDGITWKYIYPVLRFVLRISPIWISQVVYGTSIRRSTRMR